ncbi:uncharacterized protein AB675_8637 [Cyphellophora attinorum]|uniref:Uncharacterized protein n=1 Tax=Cyphellophora attinorum TaxID=1664694 RepID=A0A0N1HGG0_9EURO|nr:uncharacterized protein AB675_8637 [Phialophora attinorum]KPI44662.1 hypothetical protein AB675_8637 [Phialophora attinorum]
MRSYRLGTRQQGRLDSQPRQQASLAAYDAESGQMFTEHSVQVRSRQHSDWIGELRTPSLAKKAGTPEQIGARSLVDAAVIMVAEKLFRDLGEEHFFNVPWNLAERVWQHVLATHRESFHTWRVLASTYAEQMSAKHHRYHIEIRQPSLSLPDYFSGLTSRNWLACLRLSPKETRTADLINICEITNLAVLDLSNGQVSFGPDNVKSPFDERILRSWAELAATGQAFVRLEALMLGWEQLGLWLFQYLPCFPALTKLVITDSSYLHQKNRKSWEPVALNYGWEARHAKRSAKSLRPVFDEPAFHRFAVSGILSQYSDAEDLPRNEQKTSDLPVVEACLGMPKKWAHILDDFPGSRTIYLERVKVVDKSRCPLSSSGSDSSKRSLHPERSPGSSSLSDKRVPRQASKARQRAIDFAEILG